MAGKIGSALPALSYATLDLANDLLTIFDASDATDHDKKIAVGEFIKRSLGTTDLSWMSTLGIASLATDDLFLISDTSASAAIKKMTASDVLSRTLAGATIAWLSSLTMVNVDGTNDRFLVWDNDATAWKVMAASEIKNRLLSFPTEDYTSTPTTITSAMAGQRSTNRGATQVIEFDLPSAVVGMRYSFMRIADYAVRMDPNGTQTIGAGAAGKYLEITGRGQVDIECLATGEWEIVGGSSIADWEP